jgi:hypothetical protein
LADFKESDNKTLLSQSFNRSAEYGSNFNNSIINSIGKSAKLHEKLLSSGKYSSHENTNKFNATSGTNKVKKQE